MQDYLSQELRQTILSNTKQVHNAIVEVASASFSPESILADVQTALGKQRALYQENLKRINPEILGDLDVLLESDFQVSESYVKGSDMLLDILYAKQEQIEQLASIESHLKNVVNAMNSMESNLLEISKIFHDLLA